jgi:anti-anti-sigma factor
MSIRQLAHLVPDRPDNEPLLSLDVASRDCVTVITISGEVDLCTAHLIIKRVQGVTRDHHSRVVVMDMSGVNFFGADGLRALLQCRDSITAAGARLVLRAPSAPTWRILTLTHTDHLFPLDNSIAD